MDKKTEKENKLQLIPKAEKYIEYILQIIIKLPRVEKFSIGNEYKQSMYQMIRKIMYINKIGKGIELRRISGIEYIPSKYEETKNEIAKYIDNEFINETIKEIVNYINTTSKVLIDDSNW